MIRKLRNSLYCLILVLGLILPLSCHSQNNTENDLISACVRDCVLETGDATICDTRCRCAVEAITSENTKESLSEMVKAFSDKNSDSDTFKQFKILLERCSNSSK